MSVQKIEKSPEYANDRVCDCETPIEWQFCDLRCRKLAVCVAEFDDACVIVITESEGANTVVASAQDRIVDGGWIIEVDRLGYDLV